jgi:hypothetical protein
VESLCPHTLMHTGSAPTAAANQKATGLNVPGLILALTTSLITLDLLVD